MEENTVKEGIIKAFKGIITDLSVSDIEDIQDLISIQIHKRSKDYTYIDIENVMAELELD